MNLAAFVMAFAVMLAGTQLLMAATLAQKRPNEAGLRLRQPRLAINPQTAKEEHCIENQDTAIHMS